jgi:hypothetical protein
MSSAATLRIQIESALADRIPSALTPAPRIIRPVCSTGIQSIDAVLKGGLPLGAITEVVGPECSGRTSFALSFIAQMTQDARVCAWIDVSDALHPESAAAAGVNLSRLLWVRCGVTSTGKEQRLPHNDFVLSGKYLVPRPVTKGLHGGGCGPHPLGEVKGLPDAIGGLLRPDTLAPRCAEPQRRERSRRETFEPNPVLPAIHDRRFVALKPWARVDQALRVTDLLLQAGGFSSIVLDMGGIAPEFVSRVPLATWFRYRAAAERTQASILLLTQYASAKSSAGLVLRMRSGNPLQAESTVLAGVDHRVEIVRERFAPASNVIPLRKPPQSESHTSWQSHAAWAGRR